MDQLAYFFPGAHWLQKGQNIFYYDDDGLGKIWIKVAAYLPPQFKGCGLQAQKITDKAKMVEQKGFMKILSGKGTIIGGKALTPDLSLVSFEKEIITDGFLLCILAIPQTLSLA